MSRGRTAGRMRTAGLAVTLIRPVHASRRLGSHGLDWAVRDLARSRACDGKLRLLGGARSLDRGLRMERAIRDLLPARFALFRYFARSRACDRKSRPVKASENRQRPLGGARRPTFARPRARVGASDLGSPPCSIRAGSCGSRRRHIWEPYVVMRGAARPRQLRPRACSHAQKSARTLLTVNRPNTSLRR